MAQITWTHSALQDLKQIHTYISDDSVFYADRFIKKLISRIEILEVFPLSGRIIPEKEDIAFRELIEGNYRIFYNVEKENIFILRVHHSARNFE